MPTLDMDYQYVLVKCAKLLKFGKMVTFFKEAPKDGKLFAKMTPNMGVGSEASGAHHRPNQM